MNHSRTQEDTIENSKKSYNHSAIENLELKTVTEFRKHFYENSCNRCS